MKIDRRAYAEMFGPTVGDRVRLADTDLIVEVERDLTDLRRGGEVRRRQGHPRRHGAEPAQSRATCADTVITNALDPRLTGASSKADIGDQGRPHRAASARPAIPTSSPASTSSIGAGHRDHRRRRHDRHGGRHRLAHPFHLPAADRRSADVGHHDDDRRRHRPGDGHERDDVHARARGTSSACSQAAEAFPMNLGFLGKGNASLAPAAARADRGRRDRPEAARGLGHDAGGDRQLPARSPTRCDVQVAIHTDTLNESGFVETRSPRFKGRTIHTYHTEGAGGGHAPDIIKVVRRAERAAVVDQSDAALHGQHHRRASRHADGVPPPRPGDRRGRRVRRVAHPPRDDRRRGHPARPRRVLDDVVATRRRWAASAR